MKAVVVKNECEKCGSKVFLVDEVVTHLEVDGDIVKSFLGELTNRKCIRCNDPEMYKEYKHYDEE